MTDQVAFAFFAGSVATANPCGFALLPAYLARQLGSGAGTVRRSEALAHALAVGALMTAGFLLVFGSVGAAISLGAHWLVSVMPWAGLAIGIALVLGGLAVLAGNRIPLRLPVPGRRSARGGVGPVFLFGVGYSIASLSCTLPIFLAVVVGGGVSASPLEGVRTLAAYAAGMGTIVTALAVTAALARSGLAFGIRRLLPYVTRLSGALLLVAGVYVVYYWAFFLLPGSTSRESGRKPIDVGNQLSMTLQGGLSDQTGQLVVEILLGIIGALLVWTLWRRLFPTLARRGDAARDTAPPLAGPSHVPQEEDERAEVGDFSRPREAEAQGS